MLHYNNYVKHLRNELKNKYHTFDFEILHNHEKHFADIDF